ncbi:hypothetical protein [Pedobacter frigoris]|uniref:Uncharacterized protein n=1 Tax=Pedobacter frigoris TaxID=2571272 RepID=A0A4V5NZL3_9SPHI|nr:hypothetical protein [Pedobacter frigoris]TKC09072.1 hypothetical protein FA047_02960 [Pedobacter frigoris]
MGKYDGKHLTGLVGPLVIRKGKKGQIVSTKADKVKQTQGTKDSSSMFAKCSTFGKEIRDDLNGLFGKNSDGEMVNRLQKEIRAVMDHCYDKETKTFHFNEYSFDRLQGFDFNEKSPLKNTLWLWIQPQVQISNNILNISLPEFIPNEEIRFPDDASICELELIVGSYGLNVGYHRAIFYQAITIQKDQIAVPAQEWTFEVPDGCLCIPAIGLNFYKTRGNFQTNLNSKIFNPAAIIGAPISPGTFVVPPRISGPVYWSPMGVKFPAENEI